MMPTTSFYIDICVQPQTFALPIVSVAEAVGSLLHLYRGIWIER